MRLAHRASTLAVAIVVYAAGCGNSSNNAVDAGKKDSGSGDGAAQDGAAGAGGGDGAAAHEGGAIDLASLDVTNPDSPMSMSLTSTALAEGGMFAAANTCAGANTSPPLTWTAGPTGTMSYAVTLTDLDIDAVHWVIWDIPATTLALPADLPGDTTLTTPVMAMQVHKAEFFGAGGAYRGPCPSGATHTYQFQVNAIGTATLAGVTTASTTEAVRTAVQAASLAHGDLFGTSNASAPPPADAGGE
jgi:Raf kinase inhibitor-like YbhB/YbcL family protein